MLIRTSVVLLALLSATVEEMAAQCPAIVTIAEGNELIGPPLATRVVVLADSEEVLQVTIAGGRWTPSAQDVQTISAAAPSVSLRVQWLPEPDAGQPCESQALLGSGLQASSSPAGSIVQCRQEGMNWEARISAESRQRRIKGYTVLVFMENSGLCYFNREYGVYGEPIHVGIYTTSSTAWRPVQFEPCAIESGAPRLFVPATATFPAVQAGTWELVEMPPRRCYNESLDIVLRFQTSGSADTQETRFPLSLSPRYHGTLQLGVAFTDQHERTFGLRPDGDEMVIYDRGPIDSGPEYTVTVALYGLFHQLASLLPGVESYAGRDIVRENGLLDRVGGVLGVGLNDPGRRFMAGFAIEAVRGINILAVWDFARVKTLADIEPGDVFIGEEDDIPVRDEWRSSSLILGVGLDLRYVAALFERN